MGLDSLCLSDCGLKPAPSFPSPRCSSSSSSSSTNTSSNSTSTTANFTLPSSSSSHPSFTAHSSPNNPSNSDPSIHTTTQAQPDLKPDLEYLYPANLSLPHTDLHSRPFPQPHRNTCPPSNTSPESEADKLTQSPLHQPFNPYSITRSPSQPMFVMPSLTNSFSNQLAFDGSSYADSLFSSNFFDSRQFSPSQSCQSIPSPASHIPQSHHYFSLHQDYPDSKPLCKTNKDTPCCHVSTSMLTPSVTCSSRQPSELINDDQHSSSSSNVPSLAYSSPICPKLGFPHTSSYSSPYSRSGFDLMGALARVVTRPHPKIKVGPVDASAALVVVDARQNDLPIIFASPSFSSLTGYENSEIIGQNCRFLQNKSNSNVIKNNPVESTDPSATLQIRSHIQAGREIQSSIINYRKDGEAFINLVTVIPIAWDSSEISHFVGFQVDIVSLTNKLGIPPSPSGHSHSLQVRGCNTTTADAGTVCRKSFYSSPKPKEASSSLPSLPAESRSSMADLVTSHCYYQTVLSESRDLIFTISLKGTLFYVSSSCESILGYREEMLINQNISKICHPGDLTGILRQLKLIGNTSHTPIDLVFRAINKQGEYFWLESQGQLHVEAGKGRKYLVVVARPRVIGPLSWQAIRSVGGLGDNEFWMKLSLDGLCLFATHPVRELLSYEPGEMMGKSLSQLSSPEEHRSIMNAIQSAYDGNDVITLSYSLKNRTGSSITFVGNFYPPHYSKGPQACNMSLPSSKMSNPPPFIFCQTNSLSSAQHHHEENRSDKDVPILRAQSSLEDNSVASSNADPLHQETFGDDSLKSCPSSKSEKYQPEDDLFACLGTNKTTPWNCEFSQLKRQNHKLRSELQKGSSSGRSRNGVSTRLKSIHLPVKSSGGSYYSRLGHHETSTQEVVYPAVDLDPSVICFNDNMLFQADHSPFPEKRL